MPTTDQALQAGTLLNHGTFKIVKVLGRGGFGITYLAINVQLGTMVAIKEFFPKGMYNREEGTTTASVASKDNADLTDKLKAKFLKEARRIASLSHPSIVRVTGAFEENDTAYYVMDYIEGRNLLDTVKMDGPMNIDRASKYISEIGQALAYLHSLKINHLDVKPANIIVDNKTGRAVLIDFGLSKQYDECSQQTSTTPVGVSEGYAPIEQYNSSGVTSFSAPTDIYALGATLYFLLVGKRPPSADHLVEESLEFPSYIPQQVRHKIEKAMMTRRADRFQSVGEFLSGLESPLTPNRVAYEAAEEVTVMMGGQTSQVPQPTATYNEVNTDEEEDDDNEESSRWPTIIKIVATIIIIGIIGACIWKYNSETKPNINALISETGSNLDMMVKYNGMTGFISLEDWESLPEEDQNKLYKVGLVVKQGIDEFILALNDIEDSINWDNAVHLYRSSLPTKAEGMVLITGAQSINDALTRFGGTPMDTWYWTSEEAFDKKQKNALTVNMHLKEIRENKKRNPGHVREIIRE